MFRWLDVFVVLLSVFGTSIVCAQTLRDTLSEVQIHESRREQTSSSDWRIGHFSVGQKHVEIDSLTKSLFQFQSLSALLSQQTSVSIKSYGFNGLATLNMRGSSAAQTLVLWNGIPINNAALGLSDISNIPVGLMGNIQLQYGGSSALLGSGNVGGAILLSSDTPRFVHENKYTLSVGVGSFSQGQGAAKFSINRKQFCWTGQVMGQLAKNDFLYHDVDDKLLRMSHAKLRGVATQQSLSVKLNQVQKIQLDAWYQQYYREIPAATFEAFSDKIRQDYAWRVLVTWNRNKPKSNVYIKSALLNDKMFYRDDTINLQSNNLSHQSFTEAGLKKRFGTRHEWMIFSPIQILWMNSMNEIFQQQRFAWVVSYAYHNQSNRLQASTTIRQENVDRYSTWLPGGGMSYLLAKGLTFKLNVQRSFRAPTLNELYFQPGGNTLLKPEIGWSEDVGISFKSHNTNRFRYGNDFSFFNRVINDWIIWLGGSIWTPHNIASVHSRGIEWDQSLTYTLERLMLHVSLHLAYTKATTLNSYLPNDQSLGKQIPYTPLFVGVANIGATWKRWYLNLNESYTGARYINMDETDRLLPFAITNFQLSYAAPLGKKRFSVFAQINNLFNQSYQIMNGRPMPGTNGLLGLRFEQ
ncbi:MAG: TonB-dependent receptor [Bacteroidetes bacterium]|nr:TonB-dependent receptor [Bacteroidota bacterium]MBS1741225.1 TonB-dependent receptor [Bacteroidota bacterium]